MVTVMELLSHPQFANFQLITDTSGLSNQVTKTGILDWESSEDIRATFNPGEFVLTTLSGAMDDTDKIDELLQVLMEKKVSAIAIKNIHHYPLSTETIRLANLHRTPIFLFHETYVDDLIYVIRNSVDTNSLNGLLVNKVRRIMDASNSDDIKALAQDLNPFFFENHVCCFCIPKVEKDFRDPVMDFSNCYRKSISSNRIHPNTSFLMVEGNGSVIFIVSTLTVDDDPTAGLKKFLESVCMTTNDFRIGISRQKMDLSQLRTALMESFFSALTCFLNEEEVLNFGQIGADQLLMPAHNSPWTHDYYRRFYDTLTEYDNGHNTNMHETLLMYVRNNGDISLTADMLFQHQNTIHYRLSRIKEVLGIDDEEAAYIQMYFYARLHRIYALLNREDLL